MRSYRFTIAKLNNSFDDLIRGQLDAAYAQDGFQVQNGTYLVIFTKLFEVITTPDQNGSFNLELEFYDNSAASAIDVLAIIVAGLIVLGCFAIGYFSMRELKDITKEVSKNPALSLVALIGAGLLLLVAVFSIKMYYSHKGG